MDAGATAEIISGLGASITVIGAIATTVVNRRDKEDRRADRTEKQALADKLRAEKREIEERASSIALGNMQGELKRVQTELRDAYKEADRLRKLLSEKNDQIDAQDRTIRRLTRRAETLEEWIESNCERFEQLGINGLPDDPFDDRRHNGVNE